MAQEGLYKEAALQGFLGVNLRRDRLSLEDFDLARAINADLHLLPGVIVKRLGRRRQFATALSDLVVRRLAKISGKRYQVSGQTLYRDQVSILTGLHNNLITSLAPFRPLDDSVIWAFVADDAVMRKDQASGASTVRTWGIAAPTFTPTLAAGTVGDPPAAGTYQFRVTYARLDGTAVAHESNPSPSASITIAVARDIDLSGLTASSDAQVTHKRIYRTLAGGSLYFFDQQIADATTTATSSQADTALGAAVETDNDRPPVAAFVSAWQEHLWLCRDASNPHYLWYSKRFRPESYPPGNFIEIGDASDALQCTVPYAGMLGVFSRLTKYRVTGNSSSGFYAPEAPSHRGTPAPMAAIATEQGLFFIARDGFFLTTLGSPDMELSGLISGLFAGEMVNDFAPINWDLAEQMSAAYWKRRLYVSFARLTGSTWLPNTVAVYSFDTSRWYFYDHPLASLLVEEDVDQLVGGGVNGFASVLEAGDLDETTAISLDVETKDWTGDNPHGRKLFAYVRFDVDAKGDTVSADFVVDGSLERTYSLTGTRSRRLLPVPPGVMGYSWRVRFRHSGQARAHIYGVTAFYMPMEAAA